MVAQLQFDAGTNHLRTVAQTCLAGDVELNPTSSFTSSICQVSGNLVVTQLTASTLSFVQLGEEITSFTVAVKPTSSLKMACIDDVRFLPNTSGSCQSLAVLGKSEPHSWVGRAATIGQKTGVVRLITVDMSRKTLCVNWSFEGLPSDSFELTPLPAPRRGFLVTSPDNVSYCEEFSSSVTISVNPAGQNASTVHYLNLDEEFPIDLTGSESIALSDEFALFATRTGQLLGCHLVRQSGAFNTVSDMVWERLAIAETLPRPSSLSLLGNLLFIASEEGNSFLYQLSQKEILLPISVFPSSAEETRLVELEQSASDPAIQDLVARYQDEVHRAKISHSVELGLLDQVAGSGGVGSMIFNKDEDSSIVTTSFAGSMVSMYGYVPADLVFELAVRDMKYVMTCRLGQYHLLVLASEARILIIDCSNGLRELGRVDLTDPILGLVKTATEDGHVVFMSAKGLGKVKLVTLKQESPLQVSRIEVWNVSACRSVVNGNAVWVVNQISLTSLQIIQISSMDGSMTSTIPISIPEGREITCFNPSVVDGSLYVTVCDNQGSLYVFTEAGAVFMAKHASVCRPVLVNELEADSDSAEFIPSITDPTKKPLEASNSTGLFAEKVRIVDAGLCKIGTNTVLIIIVEGRPVLVYLQMGDKFVLQVYDSVPSLAESGLDSCAIHPMEGDRVLIAFSRKESALLRVTDRGQVRMHYFNTGGVADMSSFTSEYLDNGFVVVSPLKNSASNLGIFKLKMDLELDSRFPSRIHKLTDSRFGVDLAVSLPGIAIATVTDEEDPGIMVPLAPSEEPDEMMDGPSHVQMNENGEPTGPAVLSSVLITCPVPPMRQKHQVQIMSRDMDTITAMIAMQPGEFVTSMSWADSVLGLGPDVLIIGTTFALGEETPAQGRVVVVRVDYAPGVTAPAVELAENELVAGGKILYDSVKRAAVTIVRAWRGCVAVGLGHRLMMYQWDAVAGRLRGVGMIDLGLQITSMTFFKNFIVAGDILRGVYLLRYKEDPVMDAQMNVISMAASIQQLAKSFPLQDFSAVNVETIRKDGSVGIVSIDTYGNLDLEIFSPVHFGMFLRHSVPFNLPSRSLGVVPVTSSSDDKALLIASSSGSLAQLVPVSEAEHHLASTLIGLMVSLLPQAGGVNPRVKHVGMGREHLATSVQAIESIDCLVEFLFLATPLQAEIANRMKQPIDLLMRTVARWLRPIF